MGVIFLKNKQRRRLSTKYKLILQITASLFLLLAVYFAKQNVPFVFEKIKSSLTYTPDISVYTQYARDFILKYTPK